MDAIERTHKYILNTYKRYPLLVERARGSWIWDKKGRKYLDFFSGLAVSGIGHTLPEVTRAIRRQAGSLLHTSNLYYTEAGAKLAEVLCKRSFAGKVFFSNSGAEANECAIKLARRYGHRDGRHEIIVFENSFHGRTLGALAATAQPKFHEGFGPLPEGFPVAKMDDIESVKRLIRANTAAILIEPVQGEGGVNPAEPEFLKALRILANEHKLLLMFDGVQCSLGRTGDLFSYQSYDVEPDVLTLAKGLGGGMPIGATLIRESLADVLKPGDHGTTFGANPVCCEAALAVMKLLTPKLFAHVRRQSALLIDELSDMINDHPAVEEMRAIGLMVGIQLRIPGAPFVEEARARGLLINCTQGNVLRFLPPLALTDRERKFAVNVLHELFDAARESPTPN